MRHWMNVGKARDFVRNMRGSVELMYAEDLSPALAARRFMLAIKAGLTDPTTLAHALKTHTDPYSIVTSEARSG